MERPEAMETGSIVITGLEPDAIRLAVRLVTGQREAGQLPEVPADYLVANCSQRVVNLMIGTAGVAKVWSNLAPTESFWERR